MRRGDLAAAAPIVAAACASGSRAGCADSGAARARLGTPAALAEAVALYRRACDAGDPVGCLRLGEALARGAGVAADPPGAAAAFVTACKGGEAAACTGLAELFDATACTLAAPPPLDADARAVLRAACADGHAARVCAAVAACPPP